MIEVEKAEEIIRKHPYGAKAETISLDASMGRVLAEGLVADRDFPPFDRVMMDGIAITHRLCTSDSRRFKIAGTVGAGYAPEVSFDPAHCVEIMTGAVLPQPYDTIVRYEDVEIEDGYAKVLVDGVTQGAHIHRQGSDKVAGEVIVPAGRRMSASEIGVAASTGYASLSVLTLPRIAVIATGDELVPVGGKPSPYQIRSSNEHVVEAALSQWGQEVDRMHVNDAQQDVEKLITSAIDQYDVLIFLGGTSKGKYDFVPDALKKCGVKQHFHRVKQRPGKPLWFGSKDSSVHVFALPGNPVSAFMCLQKYILPWLNNSLGVPIKTVKAMLEEDVQFESPLTYFMQVQCRNENGQLFARPIEGRGSGDLANLVNSDAFLQLPAERSSFKHGELFPLIPFRSFLS